VVVLPDERGAVETVLRRDEHAESNRVMMKRYAMFLTTDDWRMDVYKNVIARYEAISALIDAHDKHSSGIALYLAMTGII